MSTLYPIEISGAAGVERVVGLARFPDPSKQPGAEPKMGLYSGAAQSINDGSFHALPWSSLDVGDALLDLTVGGGFTPAFLTPGAYAIAVTIIPGALTVAGSYTPILKLGANGLCETQPPPSTAAIAAPSSFLAATVKAAAGDQLSVGITNNDGAAPVDFEIALGLITKIG